MSLRAARPGRVPGDDDDEVKSDNEEEIATLSARSLRWRGCGGVCPSVENGFVVGKFGYGFVHLLTGTSAAASGGLR